jgi:hypothetical protein
MMERERSAFVRSSPFRVFIFEEKNEKLAEKKRKKPLVSLCHIIIDIIMSGGENNNKQMTTRERQQIEVAKLEAELNALKVDAAKVRGISLVLSLSLSSVFACVLFLKEI